MILNDKCYILFTHNEKLFTNKQLRANISGFTLILYIHCYKICSNEDQKHSGEPFAMPPTFIYSWLHINPCNFACDEHLLASTEDLLKDKKCPGS